MSAGTGWCGRRPNTRLARRCHSGQRAEKKLRPYQCKQKENPEKELNVRDKKEWMSKAFENGGGEVATKGHSVVVRLIFRDQKNYPILYKWVKIRSLAHPITKKLANAKDPSISTEGVGRKTGRCSSRTGIISNDNKRMVMLRT